MEKVIPTNATNPNPNPNPNPNLNPANAPAKKPGSGSSNLSKSSIKLIELREQARKEFCDILDSVRGKKALVLDASVSGPLGLVCEVSMLKDHGVEKIFSLTPGKLMTDIKNIIYLVRPKVNLMKLITEHISSYDELKHGQRDYFVYFVPRRTMLCERLLEEEGVWQKITCGEYQLDLIPIDDDLLSLELESSYRECFLDGDRTCLYYVARALMKLQSIYGTIPNIKAKGNYSKLVVDMLLRMKKEMNFNETTKAPEIDQLILIDRDVDLITPMCTQLTYEGLIDEIFGINNTYVDLDPELVGKDKGKKVKTPLNNNDHIFSDIRYKNFTVVGPELNKKAKEIEEYYKQRHEAKTITQIRDFMKKFANAQQEHASLTTHTGIAQRILEVTKSHAFHKHLEAEQSYLAGMEITDDYLEDCIDKKEPLLKVLRLLCLQSLTNNGIKAKQLEYLKREILQTYGYQYLFTLQNLEKLGLLKKQETKNPFNVLRKNLHLIVEDLNENKPTDIAYVYSGYAPLSIRIIQTAFKPGWKAKEETLRLLPGPVVEESQKTSSKQTSSRNRDNLITLVFFIGGVTFTEIAALKWLSAEDESFGDIVIATTKLISGNTLLSSVMEEIEIVNEAVNQN